METTLPHTICPYCYARVFHAVYFGHPGCPNPPKYFVSEPKPNPLIKEKE